jgi:hypothetical protein
MPPVEAQRRALSMLNELDPVRQLQGEMRSEFEALLSAVLHRAFRGVLWSNQGRPLTAE